MVASGARVSWILATAPAAIVVAFKPVTRQVSEPDAGAHRIFLPACVATDPAVALMAETWLAGYNNVH